MELSEGVQKAFQRVVTKYKKLGQGVQEFRDIGIVLTEIPGTDLALLIEEGIVKKSGEAPLAGRTMTIYKLTKEGYEEGMSLEQS